MYRIHCKECDEEIILDTIPERCTNPNCRCPREECLEIEMIPTTQDESTTKENQQLLKGITLIYQKTGEEIYIPKKDKIILGRESQGHEVLGKVKYISRVHCEIEFIDNKFVVTDLNSTNGTFLGISRIDCKANTRQELNDGDILYLGKEPFLIKFNFESSESKADLKEKIGKEVKIGEVIDQTKEVKAQKYRCKDCGAVFDAKEDICPKCNAFGTLERFGV